MSDEKQGERFYVIAAGAQLVDLTKSFGTVEEATFAAQRGQMTQATKFVVLGIRFCATIITAAAPAAISNRGRRRGSARVVYDVLPPGRAALPTTGYLNPTPIALNEVAGRRLTIDEIQHALEEKRDVKIEPNGQVTIDGEIVE